MTLKAAVAGLPHGGGKAIVLADPRTEKTQDLLSAYGEMLADDARQLLHRRGCRTDTCRRGLPALDHAERARHDSGRQQEPLAVTAYGVYLGIRATVRHRFATDSLEGLRFRRPGARRRRLRSGAPHLRERRQADGRRHRPGAPVAGPGGMAGERSSIPRPFSKRRRTSSCPARSAASSTRRRSPPSRVGAIAGAANNQLAVAEDAERLRRRGILYAPDYVINGAGLINVAAELEHGGYDQTKVLRRVEAIPGVLARIFERADRRGKIDGGGRRGDRPAKGSAELPRGAPPRRRRPGDDQASLASSVTSIAPSAFETGQLSFASRAMRMKVSSWMPGTWPVSEISLRVISKPRRRPAPAHHGLRLEPFGRRAVLGQEMRKLHREAAGMRGGDQLLGIRAALARFVLEPRLEGIGRAPSARRSACPAFRFRLRALPARRPLHVSSWRLLSLLWR